MVSRCVDVLKKSEADIDIHIIPGCLEFALASQKIIQQQKIDAIICIGVLMKGETHHYEMILQSCSSGMQKVSLDSGIPLINAVLPVTNMDQVKERASDNDYNKGIEAALAAIEFITWEKTFSNQL